MHRSQLSGASLSQPLDEQAREGHLPGQPRLILSVRYQLHLFIAPHEVKFARQLVILEARQLLRLDTCKCACACAEKRGVTTIRGNADSSWSTAACARPAASGLHRTTATAQDLYTFFCPGRSTQQLLACCQPTAADTHLESDTRHVPHTHAINTRSRRICVLAGRHRRRGRGRDRSVAAHAHPTHAHRPKRRTGAPGFRAPFRLIPLGMLALTPHSHARRHTNRHTEGQ